MSAEDVEDFDCILHADAFYSDHALLFMFHATSGLALCVALVSGILHMCVLSLSLPLLVLNVVCVQ